VSGAGLPETTSLAASTFASFEDFTFTYDTASEPSLTGLTLGLRADQLTLISGPSGSGKSTLARVVAGFIPRPLGGNFEGTARVLGHDVEAATAHALTESVGVVFDNPFDQLTAATSTAFDEVAYALENEGLLPVAGGGPRIESRVIWTHYEDLEPMAVRYDSGISLVGVALGQRDIQVSTRQLIELGQDRTMWVAMRWQETVYSDTEYAASLRLHPEKDKGSWVFQEDLSLWKPVSALPAVATPGALIDTLVRLEVPEELPAGEYQLRLVIYDAETLQPVVQDGTWEPELLLARLRLN